MEKLDLIQLFTKTIFFILIEICEVSIFKEIESKLSIIKQVELKMMSQHLDKIYFS